MKEFLTTNSAWITGIVLLLMIVELIRSKTRPSIVFSAVVITFLALGYVDINSILQASITKSVLIIFLVISISDSINQHIDIGKSLDLLLGKITSPRLFLAVLCICVALISSLFNNTPVVIILIPFVMQKADKYGISPSKLLIPLSFSAILGGMITLIGTSTNLVLNGLLETNGLELFKFYDFLVPGLLVSALGILFMVLFGFKLLPSGSLSTNQKINDVRKFFVEAKIGNRSRLIGKSLLESGLKDIKGVSLLEVVRDSRIFDVTASKNLILEEADRLIFSGSLNDVMQLNAGNTNLEFIASKRLKQEDKLKFVELSIPSNSHLNGKKINQTNFRQKYGATILAVHRNSEDLSGRIGEIVLKSGDLLIIVPHDQLTEALKLDFHILSNLTKEKKTAKHKYLLLTGIIALITLFAFQKVDLFLFLLLVLGLLIAIGYTSTRHIKNGFRLDLFVVLISSIIVGDIFMKSGLSESISSSLLTVLSPFGNGGIILGLMLFTVLLTSFITNVAAVSIAFPLAYSISSSTGLPDEALFLAVAFSASAAFMTPIGYQTNLIVMAPGNYKFKDFLKIGAPLTIIYIFVVWCYIRFTY